MKLTIEIDGLPPPEIRLNGRKRSHWRTQVREELNGWLWLAKLAMMPNTKLIPKEPWGHVLCHVHFVLPDRRDRDPDNFFAGVKEVIDDFVVGWGIIPKDTFEHIAYFVDGEVIFGQAKTIITLTKAEVLGA